MKDDPGHSPSQSLNELPIGFHLQPGLPPRIHLLGIGGAGQSAAARILESRGFEVTGHDREASVTLEMLSDLDIRVRISDSKAQDLPEDAALVVRSAAVPETDPQVQRAHERGIPVIKYADLLARIAPENRTLAVAGTHGKTTSAWMLWFALEGVRGDAGRGPSPGALIGGTSRDLGVSAIPGDPDGWFATEACEYDRSFLKLAPFGAIVTNLEGDHLDYYGSLSAIEEAFARFCSRVSSKGLLVLGRDVPECVEHAATCTVWRLGRDFEIDLLGERKGYFRFRLRGPGWSVPEVALEVPGSFNVDNAALALALAIGVGSPGEGLPVKPDPHSDPGRGIEMFTGVGRRFEDWGEEAGVQVVHDYAHHPTEVRVTLEAARRTMPGRPLHVLFQPHQHSRTARFLDEFCESLRSADRVVVSDVYGARTHIDGQRFAGAQEIVDGLRARLVEAELGGDLAKSLSVFTEGLPSPAAALVLGAGDIDNIRDELLDDLALRSASKSRPIQ